MANAAVGEAVLSVFHVPLPAQVLGDLLMMADNRDGAWENFLQNFSDSDSTVSVSVAMSCDGDNDKSSAAGKDTPSATLSDLDEVPGKCILKKPQAELISYVEKWLTTLPPLSLPNMMTLERWAKIMTEQMASDDPSTSCLLFNN
ncbi:hypothetical protein ARMGADRAFT_1021798 [Armillaria gallica]|uniref:Uncharacterized protein n=1 Tax=Armillaria gallica TaxID=47427 RepID=A0A2H3E6J8_ARMGA|nr:hypothetical protein ARMGADRAFT_1021798 [Armillaria gallica]